MLSVRNLRAVTQQEFRYHPVVARLYDPVQWFFERYQAPAHREYLAADLGGDVLELAAGTGPMVPYYETGAAPDTSFYAVEPDPGMRTQLRANLAESPIDMQITSGLAQSLPFEDDSFDYVVESGLLCQVPSVEETLAEISRCLKPEGEFRFFDHVRSDGLLGRTQEWFSPVWRSVGGFCHLDRRLGPEIRSHDGLELREMEQFTVGIWPVRRFIRGRSGSPSC